MKKNKATIIKEIMSDELNILHERIDNETNRIDKLEEILHSGLGPCPECTGSGMVYETYEAERNGTIPCETCKGTGKMPLDLVDMIEQFKVQARKDIEMSKIIPF